MAVTKGQKLYEYLRPKYTPMVPWHKRRFATREDIVLVPNENHVGWQFLTAKSKAEYEEQAKTHWFTNQEASL